MTAEERDQFTHLGDGLYIKFTGYSFEVRVNDHRNPAVAHFEPDHVDRFKEFKDRKMKERGQNAED